TAVAPPSPEEGTPADSALNQPGAAIDSAMIASPDTVASDAESTMAISNPFEIIPDETPTMLENLRRDASGNAVALVVLAGMIVSVFVALGRLRAASTPGGPHPAILAVALVGLVVAGYLTYVEISGATAVCGPVGDCNTVQQSRYANLFGLVPVGLLGLLGYILIVIAWLVWATKPAALQDHAILAIAGISLVGTLFSIYLTFLEPFVIGATCAWCLASSVAITLLLLLSARAGKGAWLRLTGS
ncbi:MAG: vitamin K epoxide reductase family protein, partial [Gemmatimonadota bacterium]